MKEQWMPPCIINRQGIRHQAEALYFHDAQGRSVNPGFVPVIRESQVRNFKSDKQQDQSRNGYTIGIVENERNDLRLFQNEKLG